MCWFVIAFWLANVCRYVGSQRNKLLGRFISAGLSCFGDGAYGSPTIGTDCANTGIAGMQNSKLINVLLNAVVAFM